MKRGAFYIGYKKIGANIQFAPVMIPLLTHSHLSNRCSRCSIEHETARSGKGGGYVFEALPVKGLTANDFGTDDEGLTGRFIE